LIETKNLEDCPKSWNKVYSKTASSDFKTQLEINVFIIKSSNLIYFPKILIDEWG
jgi:hypothetical protein